MLEKYLKIDKIPINRDVVFEQTAFESASSLFDGLKIKSMRWLELIKFKKREMDCLKSLLSSVWRQSYMFLFCNIDYFGVSFKTTLNIRISINRKTKPCISYYISKIWIIIIIITKFFVMDLMSALVMFYISLSNILSWIKQSVST